MAEFNELIKNFERIRDYMRDFFVYGFKVRGEYTGKSARTYDNEKRRIEAFLGNYMEYRQTPKGKAVSICVDSSSVFQNPLYAAWKAKSFTNNDIMLHFLIPECLREQGPLTAEGISLELSLRYGIEIDPQVVRLKLREYEKQGLFKVVKEGKRLCYCLEDLLPMEQTESYEAFLDSASYFQETAYFGFIGSTILDRERRQNEIFSFKHHFLVHTLEDGILSDILEAMKKHYSVKLEIKSRRTDVVTSTWGIPLKIMVSTQTGRRYVCIYNPGSDRYMNVRLDGISHVKIGAVIEDYDQMQEALKPHLPKCWGVSFGTKRQEEELQIKFLIKEKWEHFILDRLNREGRGGTLTKLEEGVYLYCGTFYDTNEMVPWVKTFIGRILDLQGTNEYAVNKIRNDMDEMYQMYFGEEDDGAIL